jgi:riboflavin kinase/FMN adenylyltransferase
LSIATISKNNITSIALGGFDGMHLGHQELFKYLDKNGAVVVIDNEISTLTPHNERKKHTSYPIFYLKLKDIRHLDAKGFITLLKNEFKNLKKIVVGYDFHFGKDRKYDAIYLKKYFDFDVIIVKEVKIGGISVHSRHIRDFIQKGDIKTANKLLGYNYTINGEVIKGQGIGSKELVATINLKIKNFTLPKEGVYAAFTRIDNEEHFLKSVSFVGHRVTTDNSFAVETHIIDKKIDCKEKAFISFVDFIRDNEKFDDIKTLKQTILNDIKTAKKKLDYLSL